MPRKEVDYSKTIIYKICCRDVNIKDCYVGHTTSFIKRKSRHKIDCNNDKKKEYNFYVYQFIRENGGWENWDMVEIEKYDCNDFNDACKRERYWIETLNATLNKVIPTRTNKEYREQNKQKIKDMKDKYYEKNKEYIQQYKHEWYIKNKNKLSKKHQEYLANL